MNPQKKHFSIGGPVLLIVLLVLSIVCVALYASEDEEGVLHTIQGSVSGIVAPLKFVGALGNSAADSAGDALSNATASDDSLSGLRDQNQQLRERVAELEEYMQEAQRLQALIGIQDAYGFESTGARVIGRNTDAWNQFVTIDKGTNDGLRSGLPVMSQAGLVGMIVSTTASTADVRLIVDPESGVSAMVQSNRTEGIVHGSLEGVLYLEDMAADANVTEGDVVITSGLGGSYFRGLIIGTVTKVERNSSGATVRAVVAPNGTISALQEVLVVLSMDTEGAASSTFSTGTSDSSTQGADGSATNGGTDANAASADNQKVGE